LNLVEQVSTNSTQTSYRTTATDVFKLINGIRRHIENDHCRCCKVALLNTFSLENIEAGSAGDQATEPAETGARNDTKSGTPKEANTYRLE
jgi:hypothetical protein